MGAIMGYRSSERRIDPVVLGTMLLGIVTAAILVTTI
jgi:hypothetical protein